MIMEPIENYGEQQTLVDLLRWRAIHQPEQRAYIFLANGEEEDDVITYAQLDRRARSIAALLQKYNASGQRALLLYRPGLEYMAAFFGCLYAGALAVPTYPPGTNQHSSNRLRTIVVDCQPVIALTTRASLTNKAFSAYNSGWEHLALEATDSGDDLADEWYPPTIDGSTLAFLQYTSGSTGTPKGVMVSHHNLLYNLAMLAEAFQHPAGAPFVSWLPLFHDLGLIGKALQAIYLGAPCVFMSSASFVQKPYRWLAAISRYQAYSSYAPNFAYELCIRKITPEQRATLDLSCWKIALNGAEPVLAETLQLFSETFAPSGFRYEAFHPAYGLAEATLLVSSTRKLTVRTVQRSALQERRVIALESNHEDAQTVVSCGHTWLDQKIIIVNPETLTQCLPDEIGEVWLTGPSIAQGYWQRPEESQTTFRASRADTGEGPFLRTGDLGFFLDGELFIAGRLKDMIIIHGQNYYPQDLELTAMQSHPGLRASGSAAFSLRHMGEERIVLLQEIERSYMRQDPQALFEAIRQQVFAEHEVHITAIVLIKPGSIPKTSSGKIQRRACREALLAQTLPIVFADIPESLNALITQNGSQTAAVPTPAPPTAQLHKVESTEIQKEPLSATKPGPTQFSLLYFSSNEAESSDNKYRLLLEGARFADQHDFTAIWIPERHFHPFGGLYPNPSVLAAALAMITKQIRLRAGSVVLPMHHPARVAEEWSTVDNLSSGRVDIAFATGWNPNDFVLAPENYAQRKDILFAEIETVQKLWSGDVIHWPNGRGQATATRIYPLPRQKRLTPWITCSGSPERFVEAGSIGANILTGLLFQSMEELGEKIQLYRDARARHGYDPTSGHVTLMLHTFVGADMDEVREKVREPFIAYLESSVDLWRHGMEKLENLSPQERKNVMSYAFERYFHTHALIGTPQTCYSMVEQLSSIGVNEIACLIDFGVDTDTVMDGLYWLNALRKRCQQPDAAPKNQHRPEIATHTVPYLPNNAAKEVFQEEHDQTKLAGPEESYKEKASNGHQQAQPSDQPDPTITQELSQSQIQSYLQRQFAQALDRSVEEIATIPNLRNLGLDSIVISSIINNCQHDLEITLDAGQFYHHTSLAGLTQYVANEISKLSGDKRRNKSVREPRVTLQHLERQGSFLLSFAQQRLWFLHQLQPDTAAYNVSTVIRIEGSLAIKALTWSLDEIIRRHESLRTTFTLRSEQPVQIIGPTPAHTLVVVNQGSLAPTIQEAQVHALARQQAQRPFDLAHGPLIRTTLLSLGDEEYVLLFTYHHIVADGWSRGIFIRELQTLYTAAIAGQPSPLAELHIQYADYAVWQRQWLQSSSEHAENQQTVLDKQLVYWKKQLAGTLPILELPAKQPRPLLQTFHGAHLPFHLPAHMMQALQTLSQQEGVSLFMTLLASFQVLLARYTGLTDILLGTPSAGRNRIEIEPLIGFFVNTLVLRTDLAGNPSFKELLQRVRDVCLGAYAHQEIPFEKVVEALQPERDLSRHPLFQIMFVLEQDAWNLDTDLPGIKLRQMATESGISTFDLTWLMTSSGVGEVEYNTDVFEADTISRLLEHWQRLLEGLVAYPELTIAELPLLTMRERQHMLVDWNQTATTNSANSCLHTLFERQVERNPQAIAVAFGHAQLTYKALDERANQLAHYLHWLGVYPEMLVGVCVERSLEMVIALLGILKIGGTYVPLDPASPTLRLNMLIANIPVFITQERLKDRLPKHALCLDTDWSYIANESTARPDLATTVDNLAYVIYTSGSTGKPKGVAVSHRGIENLASFQAKTFTLQPGSRILQFASPSFDASIWEMVMALCTGATLCLNTSEDLLPGDALLQTLRRQAITVVTLPPSALTLLPDEQLPALQTVISAGEECPGNLVERWTDKHRFFNAYGPTETTVCATIEACSATERKPTIGHPIANTEAYILDAQFSPVPIGVPGELYIGGVSLARGYLDQPGLTAERFIPHPFTSTAGSRLYRTGDLARYQADGAIEYLGRADQQVKVRGFRIELGEIETVLNQHPDVQESVVLAREYAPGDIRLIACLIGTYRLATATGELRAFLHERLPDYMLPAVFSIMETLPLTLSGKVDRQALLSREISQPEDMEAYVPPSNDVEQAVAQIWQESLRIKAVGIHTNFFEMGGHSLLMAQIHKRLREQFAREISLTTLFKYPTVATLARYLSQPESLVHDRSPVYQEQDLQVGKNRLKALKRHRSRELEG